MSNRSKKFVFIPFCLIAQAYQAQGIVKYEWKSSIKPIVQLLIDNDINIIQMPCAETSYKNSLIREPRGISKYNTKEFNEHCEVLAEDVSKQIHMICKSGYDVIAILGIEQSPSCCVNYIYTNHGMEKRKGLFMDKLCKKIEDLDIPIIGINRKYINKSLKELEKIVGNSNLSIRLICKMEGINGDMKNKKKIILIILIILLIIIIGIVVAYKLIENGVINRENFKFNVENISSTPVNTVNNDKNKENIEWDEITEEGVNEELLFQNVNTIDLEKIAALLQSLSAEIAQKEKEDINFYLSAGWYKYTLDSQQFNEVINMGNDAIKPLYLIIYKSPNQGSYEYICAMALSKLVNFDDITDSWSTSKEFLEKFNQKVINNRER